MQTEAVLYLVHIHTPGMDHYAIRGSLENAWEEVFQFAQGSWSKQFPGIEQPRLKEDVVDQYYKSVHDMVYYHIIDIENEGNWVMEEVEKQEEH